MVQSKVLIEDKVPQAWIDYNGHMNDAEYVRAFSWGVDRFMNLIGITEAFRKDHHYTIYTMENHVCYLDEMKLGEAFEVHLYVIDYDSKRAHLFFELYGEDGKRAATSEQMLMGIDQTSGKSAPFPDEIVTNVEELANQHTPTDKPKEVGRIIGIKRKS
ncbi:thioesterase family protein [Oceanobacillus halophilus]|uniref:Thioesterase n=1 Tax=Oceanobacillus halophilus TaxID=930130 RepID=A0A495A7U8_9BACI|nr:thioesterase family protein [Oceanobacillus halophilus]RKQ34565.1 thioesterase [Oceanobacillus halophilus]